jgi:hypothetical protein
MGDAVQHVEKVDHNDTQVPIPNGEVQVLDGEIGIRIRDVAHKAYPDVQEKRAVEHLKMGSSIMAMPCYILLTRLVRKLSSLSR